MLLELYSHLWIGHSARPRNDEVLARNMPMTNFCPMRYQLAPQRYESSPVVSTSSTSKTLSPEPFGVELQIGGAVSVPRCALNAPGHKRRLSPPNPYLGYSHVLPKLEPNAASRRGGAPSRGCRDGNQHGTVPVLLNRPDAAGGDGEELDEKGRSARRS